jgi:transcription elongation factor Elf1
MEKLYFACPKTGQKVDVGIESELGTLLRIRTNTVSASCPVCGEKHEWPVNEAQLQERGLRRDQ